MSTSQQTLVTVSVLLCLVVIGVHVIAGLSPAGTNWGVHHLAFFSSEFAFALILAMVLSLAPLTQNPFDRLLNRSVARYSAGSARSRVSLAAMFFVVVAALFWLFREQVFLLGDGQYLLRSLGKLQSSSQIPRVYPNEPMAGFLVWKTGELLGWMQISSTHLLAYQIVSMLSGLLSLHVIILMSKKFSADSNERVLFTVFVFCAGSIQLFFGYVENYSTTFLIVLVYTYTCVLHLRGGGSLITAAAVFGLLVSFHFGMIVIGPSLLFLLVRETVRRKYLIAFMSFLAACGSFVFLLFLSGYTLEQFTARVFQGESHLLSLVSASSQMGDNAFLSLRHLLNVVNFFGLVSPVLPVMLCLIVIGRGKIQYSDPVVAYLTISSLGGMVFIVGMRSELGMSRDWDLYAPFSLPFVFFCLYLWNTLKIDRKVSQKLLISMTALTILHTLPWVLTNASGSRGLQRFETIQDATLWSKFAICNSSEELAVQYRNNQDYANAEKQFRHAISFDSTNGRLWATLGNFLYLQKSFDAAERAFQKSIQHGYHSFQAYYALGEACAKQDRTDQAISYFKTALELDSSSSMTAYNLGAMLTKKSDNTSESFPYFLKAVQLDSLNAIAFASVGYGYYERKELAKAKEAWQKFLRHAPGSPHAAEVKALLSRLR